MFGALYPGGICPAF